MSREVVDLKNRIIVLEAEVDKIGSQRNLLKTENDELRHKVAGLHEEIAYLRDALDGMSDDMGQLEAMLSELRGTFNE